MWRSPQCWLQTQEDEEEYEEEEQRAGHPVDHSRGGGVGDHHTLYVSTILIGRAPTILRSHWSSSYIIALSLVESFMHWKVLL